ncbi:hypothetical protein GCM10022222_13880 [Amycolatopsis ultiminotia]|uniref:Uncharacterized protein n=1 Tax=Amycolatopsis ultiminotia TaxID=543629 RepID=A0ABP6VAB2_9PSEU
MTEKTDPVTRSLQTRPNQAETNPSSPSGEPDPAAARAAADDLPALLGKCLEDADDKIYRAEPAEAPCAVSEPASRAVRGRAG